MVTTPTPLISGNTLAQQQAQQAAEVKAEAFKQHIQAVSEGKDSVQTVNIKTGRRGDIAWYKSESDKTEKYSEGDSQTITTQEELESIAVNAARRYLGIGTEDTVILNGKVIQESSFTPEMTALSNQVYSGRVTAEAAYERQKQEERSRLQSLREFQEKDTARLQSLQNQTKGMTPLQVDSFLKENLKGSLGKDVLENVRYTVGNDTFSKPDIADRYRIQLQDEEKAKLIAEGYTETPLHSPEGGRIWRKEIPQLPQDTSLPSLQEIERTSNELPLLNKIQTGMRKSKGINTDADVSTLFENTVIGTENIYALIGEKVKRKLELQSPLFRERELKPLGDFYEAAKNTATDFALGTKQLVSGALLLPAGIRNAIYKGELLERASTIPSEAVAVATLPLSIIKKEETLAGKFGAGTVTAAFLASMFYGAGKTAKSKSLKTKDLTESVSDKTLQTKDLTESMLNRPAYTKPGKYSFYEKDVIPQELSITSNRFILEGDIQSKIGIPTATVLGTTALLTQKGKAAPSQEVLDKAYEVAGMTSGEVTIKPPQSPVDALFKGDRTQATNWGKEVVTKLKEAGIDAEVDKHGNIVEKPKEWSPQMKKEKLIDVNYFNEAKEEFKKKFDKDLQAETSLEESAAGILETPKPKVAKQKSKSTQEEMVEVLKGYKATGDTEAVKLITELIKKSDVSQADIEWYNLMKELPQRKFKTSAKELKLEEGKVVESELGGELILDKKYIEAELSGEAIIKTNEKSLIKNIQRALSAVGKVVFTGSKKTPWGFEYIEQGEPLGMPISKSLGYDAYVKLTETGKKTSYSPLESYTQDISNIDILNTDAPLTTIYGTSLRGKIKSETTQTPKFIRVGGIADIELAKATKQTDITGFEDAITVKITDTTMDELFFGKGKDRSKTEITAIIKKEKSEFKPTTIEDVLYGDTNKKIKIKDLTETVLESKEIKPKNIIIREFRPELITEEEPIKSPKKSKGKKLTGRSYTNEEVELLDYLESGLGVKPVSHLPILDIYDNKNINVDLSIKSTKELIELKPQESFNFKYEILNPVNFDTYLKSFMDTFTGTGTTQKQKQDNLTIETPIQTTIEITPEIEIPDFPKEPPRKPIIDKPSKIKQPEDSSKQYSQRQGKRKIVNIEHKRRLNPVDVNVIFPPQMVIKKPRSKKNKLLTPDEYMNMIFMGK